MFQHLVFRRIFAPARTQLVNSGRESLNHDVRACLPHFSAGAFESCSPHSVLVVLFA
jgi:hypothetical protein